MQDQQSVVSTDRCRLCKDAPETIQHIPARRTWNAVTWLQKCRGTFSPEVKIGGGWERTSLLDFQTQTEKLVMAKQPDMVVVDTQRKEAVVIDIVNLWWQHEEEGTGEARRMTRAGRGARKMWMAEVTVVPAVTPKLGEGLQKSSGIESWTWQKKSLYYSTVENNMSWPSCFTH